MDAKYAMIEAVTPRCLRCGSTEYEPKHHAGDGYLPECWWFSCEDCHYESEPE